MNQAQKNALNMARAEASELRKRIEVLTCQDLLEGHQYSYAVRITNIMVDLEAVLKRYVK